MVGLPQSYVDKENIWSMINVCPLIFRYEGRIFQTVGWLYQLYPDISYLDYIFEYMWWLKVKTSFSSWICGGRVRLVLPTESFFITWPGDGCAFHPLPLDHEQEDRFSHMSQSELGTDRAAAPQNVDPGWVI